jgi:hypothetical protein
MPIHDDLQGRWAQLIAAVAAEFEGHRRGQPEFDHAFMGLRLRAKRRSPSSAREWFEVAVSPAELRVRAPEQLAREFYQGYYACT